MKKKIFSGLAVFCIMLALISVCVACDNPQFDSESGKDSFGREYGQIYDIDEYQSGIYSLEYDIQDTSARGKSMISSYCYEKVKLIVTNKEISLVFYCKNSTFSDVKLGQQLGESVEEYGMYGYKFQVSREDLNAKLAMSGTVSLMNKDVAFSIVVDLSKATLIGNGALNGDGSVSGEN